MLFAKGNNFWTKRSKHGRDKLFADAELLWGAFLEYCKHVDKNPFYEVEQVKQVGKPYWDEELEKTVIPEKTVSLPRMKPYTWEGLCVYLGCHKTYFNEFEKALEGKEDQASLDFSQVIHAIRQTIYNQKLSGAAAGFFNANIIARDLGLADKQETKHSGGLTQTLVSAEEARQIAADLEKDL